MAEDGEPGDAEFRRAIEHFGLAVAELALGRGTLRERLADASVHLLAVQAHDLPEALQDDFRQLESAWLLPGDEDVDDAGAEAAGRAILMLEAELLTAFGAKHRDVIRKGTGA